MAVGKYISNINPERILWCCRQVGITAAKLAEECKISPESKLNEGKLTYNQLKKIADYFGHTALFFAEQGTPGEQVHSVEFRNLANQDIRLNHKLYKFIRQVEKHRDIYIHLLEEMEETPIYEPPALEGNVKQKARQVRNWLGISDDGEYDFTRYRNAIEDKGILVLCSQGYNGKWKLEEDTETIGFSLPNPQVPVAFVKKTSPQMQTFTLFHELGHLLLHNKSSIDDFNNLKITQNKSQEQEANRFAAHCLLPDNMLASYYAKIPSGADEYDSAFKGLAQRLGISVEVIVVGLLERGKITQRDYDDYKEYKKKLENNTINESKRGTRKYRYREPLHIFGKNYVGTVLNALFANKITLSKSSSYLDNLKIDSIKELARDYAQFSD